MHTNVNIFVSSFLVPALASRTQQVFSQYLVMRHPLSPALAEEKSSLTASTVISFIAVSCLCQYSHWLGRETLIH